MRGFAPSGELCIKGAGAPCLTLENSVMKKSLIALAVLAASGAAMAQSSVTLYLSLIHI